MPELKTPFVIVDDTVEVFESAELAEKSLEPHDIVKRNAVVFDGLGRRVRMTLKRRGLAQVVRFEGVEDEPQTEQVRNHLMRFLQWTDPSLNTSAMSIEALFDEARKHATR
jgi:hypothetical protein